VRYPEGDTVARVGIGNAELPCPTEPPGQPQSTGILTVQLLQPHLWLPLRTSHSSSFTIIVVLLHPAVSHTIHWPCHSATLCPWLDSSALINLRRQPSSKPKSLVIPVESLLDCTTRPLADSCCFYPHSSP